jgi:hypothetical protein
VRKTLFALTAVGACLPTYLANAQTSREGSVITDAQFKPFNGYVPHQDPRFFRVGCEDGKALGLGGSVFNSKQEELDILVNLDGGIPNFIKGKLSDSEEQERLKAAVLDFARQSEDGCIMHKEIADRFQKPGDFLGKNGVQGWDIEHACEEDDIKSVTGYFRNKPLDAPVFKAMLYFLDNPQTQEDEIPEIQVLDGNPSEEDKQALLDASDVLLEGIYEAHCSAEAQKRNKAGKPQPKKNTTQFLIKPLPGPA